MTAAALVFLTQLVFVFCVSYAIVSDLRRLIIPNWIPIALAVTFPVFALLHAGGDRIPAHVAVTVLVFLISMIFFVADWMGGGDIKLLAAIILWLGPSAAPEFLMVMSLLGAALAITLMIVRSFPSAADPWGQTIVARRVIELARLGQCPYGVAIGAAALMFAPRMFGFA